MSDELILGWICLITRSVIQVTYGDVTAGNKAAGAGTQDADLGAINKPVMDRAHMEIGECSCAQRT